MCRQVLVFSKKELLKMIFFISREFEEKYIFQRQPIFQWTNVLSFLSREWTGDFDFTFPFGRGYIVFIKRESTRILFIGVNVISDMIQVCSKPGFSLCMLQNHFLIFISDFHFTKIKQYHTYQRLFHLAHSNKGEKVLVLIIFELIAFSFHL